MFTPKRFLLFILAMCCFCRKTAAQDNFTWENQSIGGGGFCLEVRFNPYSWDRPLGNPRLYLASDVSGVYRSADLGATWEMFKNYSDGIDEAMIPSRYATSIAFNNDFFLIYMATNEGIFSTLFDSPNWLADNMPLRDQIFNQSQRSMDDADGKYPWIGIIREYPLNNNYMLAGIGDVRSTAKAPTGANVTSTRFGLGGLLRSTNGGSDWDFIVLNGADPKELVYDIDYLKNSSTNKIHVFISTGYLERSVANGNVYKGAVYHSDDVFTASVPTFTQITPPTITNVVNLAILTPNGGITVSQTGGMLAFLSRCTMTSQEGGGVYKAQGPNGEYYLNLSDLASAPLPWVLKYSENNTGRLGTTPGSTRSDFELFLGKQLGDRAYLAVTDQSHLTGTAIFTEITSECANIADKNICNDYDPQNDIGYREWESVTLGSGTTKWLHDLRFGSIDFNPDDSQAHPTVYGCWSYGPLKAEGRPFKQIFTQKVGFDAYGAECFQSRGMDEVFFVGCQPAFHPANFNNVLVGMGDNGLLRTTNATAANPAWSQNRLLPVQDWYGGSQQFIYHLAFHPLNADFVLASAGVKTNNTNSMAGQGALFYCEQAEAGDPNAWQILAGGPQELGGLPDAEIVSFTFDVQGDKNGVFTAVRNNGLYYGKISVTANGVLQVNSTFVKIVDSELTAFIFSAEGNNGKGNQHNYSRLVFDCDPNNPSIVYNPNHLYLSRFWPGGGVYRIELGVDGSGNRLPVGSPDFITRVDEVIRGRAVGGVIDDEFTNSNHVAEVINLLATPTAVFAGATCGDLASSKDALGSNYSGGLVRWVKAPNPPGPLDDNEWKIGGPEKIGSTNTTTAIGGITHDPFNPNFILAVTFRHSLQNNNSSDANNPKLQGEENDKRMSLWQSTDGGQSFVKLDNYTLQHKWPEAVTLTFFPNYNDRILMPTHGNGVWLGTYNGPPRAKVQAQDSALSAGQLPRRFVLHANYPNPFNPATVIKFDLPVATNVSLRIYDATGRRVRTLFDQHAFEAGYHIRVWDGKGEDGKVLASGVYFYRLITPQFERTLKMVLLH